MNKVDRARNILMQPKQEWQVIAAEATTPKELYQEYVLPLAAIGPVATLIGASLLGFRIPGGTFRVPLGASLVYAAASYALTLLGVYVFGLIINALAPSFSAQRDPLQALKVAAYSSTPGWLAGVFALVPALSILGTLGALYGLYLVYLGLLALMRPAEEQALSYTAVVIVCGILIFFVIGAICGAFLPVPVRALPSPHLL